MYTTRARAQSHAHTHTHTHTLTHTHTHTHTPTHTHTHRPIVHVCNKDAYLSGHMHYTKQPCSHTNTPPRQTNLYTNTKHSDSVQPPRKPVSISKSLSNLFGRIDSLKSTKSDRSGLLTPSRSRKNLFIAGGHNPSYHSQTCVPVVLPLQAIFPFCT